MKNDSKLDTVCGGVLAVVTECKSLFTKISFTVLSTEVICNDVLANIPYRLTRVERIGLFDRALLPRLLVTDIPSPVTAAIAYGREGDGYRFVTSGDHGLTAYAAVALDLYYSGSLLQGEPVSVTSERGRLSATVTDGEVLLYA